MQTISKNVIKEVIPVLLFVLIIGGIWFGTTTIIKNDTPIFVVSSGSMKPVLQVGDIIIVSGRINFEELEVGDIIVFTLPTDAKRVIVHRIHSIKIDGANNVYEIKTKGDNNPKVDGWTILEKNYIGTVVTSFPSIGKITIWLSPPVNYYIIFFVIIILLTKEVQKK
tara:strand:+ start:3004 stop:3504 length:501 start_codon:yes stop_codon:yes gene_type:complete